jgi:hypothetical protein
MRRREIMERDDERERDYVEKEKDNDGQMFCLRVQVCVFACA